jgi:hypothetical protein
MVLCRLVVSSRDNVESSASFSGFGGIGGAMWLVEDGRGRSGGEERRSATGCFGLG